MTVATVPDDGRGGEAAGGSRALPPLDGFWFPRAVRERLRVAESGWQTASFVRGRECAADESGAVVARWPRLEHSQWAELLAALRRARSGAPRGAEAVERLGAAMRAVGERLADPADPLHAAALNALPVYTGYSEPMIRFLLQAPALWALDDLAGAFDPGIGTGVAHSWGRLPRLPGRVRFYPERRRRLAGIRHPGRRPGPGGAALFGPPAVPDVVVGYGAGNVPGAALLIVLLSLATTVTGDAPPAVVVRNSRREPLFTPLVLAALEAVDPDLVAAVAVLVWDYEEPQPQAWLIEQADLVIAAAADETIARLGAQVAAARRPPRFHAHGHKVSFSAVAREALDGGVLDLDTVALLTALDSAFWDQNGCLSSRVHFVERGGAASPSEYAQSLTLGLRRLADRLPRGAWPRTQLHERFDKYVGLSGGGRVRVLSEYDDQFVVVLDERGPDAGGTAAVAFQDVVNDCQSRVIVVRPVGDLLELPARYLRSLPAGVLQSLSVAAGRPGGGLDDRLLEFADACGARGVTAVRSAGRGALPQLAYSWDGLLPLDLVCMRPPGRFTTIEFEAPFEAMAATASAVAWLSQ